MSIRSRLLLFFIVIVVFPTSIIMITIYNRSVNIIEGRVKASLEGSMAIIENELLQKFEAISDISRFIYLNQDVSAILSNNYINYAEDKIDIIDEMTTLDKILDSWMASDMSETVLYPRIYMMNRPEYAQYSFSNKVFDLSVVETEEWYLELPANKKYSVVGLNKSPTLPGVGNTVKIVKRLFGLKHPDVPYSALLTIDVDAGDFIRALEDFKPSAGSSVFVLDEGNAIVLSNITSMMGKSLQDEKHMDIKGMVDKWTSSAITSSIEKIEDMDMLVAGKRLDDPEWVLVTLCPVKELYGELIYFRKTMYVVLAACILLTIFLALILSKNISDPIKKIITSMKRVKGGNFDISIDYRRNDEFSYLINTFKEMLREIKELISKLYASEEKKRRAEFEALQAQINPHFLYNTLDSINWLALQYEIEDISTMVTSLSDFFRYGLSKGSSIIPLRDEIKQVESYLTIQKIRFADHLDYIVSCAQELGDYLIIKLILQPLVENSIIHGINKKTKKGMIGISVKKTGRDIDIRISDNGTGADADKINNLLDSEESSSNCFGIRNANGRIKQFFGNQYGIRYYPNPDEPTGLLVVIKIPAVEKEEELYGNNGNSRR